MGKKEGIRYDKLIESGEDRKLLGFRGQQYEQEHNYEKALEAYKMADKRQDAVRVARLLRAEKEKYRLKAAQKAEIEEKLGEEGYKSLRKALDNLVKAIMAIGGIGFIFSLFAKPYVISAENVQLAPPLPNYMVYIFGILLIIGAVYFMIKVAFRKKDIIPLSFQ
jgi:hypothetical protein